jgi:hypothetical protein
LERRTYVRNRTILTALGLSLLLDLSPLSAATVIHRGIDVFTTPDDGKSFNDFSYAPIPAGFFCKDSKAFTGKVTFKGLPLTTDPPGQLAGVDTVIERLDEAAFDKGIASTRIRFRALSLVSSAPIKTARGDFHVYVSLSPRQRMTTMTIFRTQENGGDFTAPLAVDARLTFIPVKPRQNKVARKLELTQSITFPATPTPWSLVADTPSKRTSTVTVDTDGDLIADTVLPGPSNFSAGQRPGRFLLEKATNCSCCPGEAYCHTDGYQAGHCTILEMCPGVQNCC